MSWIIPIVKKSREEILKLYGGPDTETLVGEINEATLKDLIERMSIQQESLESEVKRLKGLVAAAEILGDGGGCPWCGRWESVGHRRSCAAFTVEGIVK